MQAAEKNLIVYPPSPEYPAACCRDERQRGPAEARQSEGGLGYGEFRFDTPQLAAGSFIHAFSFSMVPPSSWQQCNR